MHGRVVKLLLFSAAMKHESLQHCTSFCATAIYILYTIAALYFGEIGVCSMCCRKLVISQKYSAEVQPNFGTRSPRRPKLWLRPNIIRACSVHLYSRFLDGTQKCVSWPNLVKLAIAKLPKGRVDYHTHKNSSSGGLVPAAILPKMGWSRPKFSVRCHLLTCQRIPNLVQIGCALPDLFRKDWFFGPKSIYNAFRLQ